MRTGIPFNANLRSASAVDEGADWVVSSRSTDVQLSPVPGLDESNEVCTFVLETQRNCNKYPNEKQHSLILLLHLLQIYYVCLGLDALV